MASAYALPARAMPGRKAEQRVICIAIIRVGEHPVFRREGDDIYVTVPVAAWESALGAKD